MRFDIYGRFQIELRRVGGRWVAYRLGAGNRRVEHDVVIPEGLPDAALEAYLSDLFHEYAQPGTKICRIG